MRFFQRPPIQRAFLRLDRARSDGIVARVGTYVAPGTHVLDIGAGACTVCWKLRRLGYDVLPTDVRNASLFPEISPLLCDGARLPFADDQFDAALLVTVLHHTPDPAGILREAARVARVVVLLEDIYEGTRQKYATFAMDSLVNLELRGHPHTNKTDAEWRALFAELGLRVADAEIYGFWRWFTGAAYHLVRAASRPDPTPS